MVSKPVGGRRLRLGRGGGAARRRVAPALWVLLVATAVLVPLWALWSAPDSAHRGILRWVSLGAALAAASLLVLTDLRDAPPRVWAACVATLSLIALLGLSRRRRRPRYEGWRLGHVILANVAILATALHVLWLDNLTRFPEARTWFVVIGLAMIAAVVNRWLFRPLRSRRHRYVVDEVRRESPTAVTLVLHAAGHQGVQFRPGQFAWLKIGTSPFVFEEHPFTIVFIAGGVGITPMLSMLRLDLHLVEILEEPPDEWDGEVGRFTQDVFERARPLRRARERVDYFICGPGPMVAAATRIISDRDVPGRLIHTELFDVV